MAELFDQWSVEGRQSLISHKPINVYEMQSEGGAVGAMHGAAASGSLTTTFTASQGLLLMIPNLYEFSGELLPAVFHVAARSLAKQALSIFGDHQDVMAVRQTGIALLCSNNAQEAQDLAAIAHISSVKCRLPFLHFFDGWRTSSVINRLVLLTDEQMTQMYPFQELDENVRKHGMNINQPNQRGTAQGPDVYFQALVANQKYYDAAPDIIAGVMQDFEHITGRKYELFDYYGDVNAERCIVMMGSGSSTAEEVIDEMNANRNEKVGVIKVRLYRPWSTKHLLELIKTRLPNVKKIAVLDRTREDGAHAQPLHMDVVMTLSQGGIINQFDVITGGQYGLSSKEFTPAMVRSIFDNLDKDKSERMDSFVIGINDDVTHTSLDTYVDYANSGYDSSVMARDTKECLFWGTGGDGTIGVNKQCIKDIADNTDQFVQGHFEYDAHKSGGVTLSHLRFGPNPIKAEYVIDEADYVSVHNRQYLFKFDQVVARCKENGTLVINSPWDTLELMESNLPRHVKQLIGAKNIQLYNIDANKIARDVGLGNRINLITQAVFYQLSKVIQPESYAINELLKDGIRKMYKMSGQDVIDMNIAAVDKTLANIFAINYPQAQWKELFDTHDVKHSEAELPKFISEVLHPMSVLKGNELPVSAFPEGGILPASTSKYEQRSIASVIPQWNADKCTQCGYCAFSCPHAVIRPFLLSQSELEQAPAGYESRKTKGGGNDSSYNYSLQISPLDCTGCQVCVEVCPDDALTMVPIDNVVEDQFKWWEFSVNGVTSKASEVNEDRTSRCSVKGSQFETPLMEFSGACGGCGETPYIKLLTQLFGKNVCVANATGCSSIWGASAPNNPYAIPWGNSLFEDNAEFGFGIAMGYTDRRSTLRAKLEEILREHDPKLLPCDEVEQAITLYLNSFNDIDEGNAAAKQLKAVLKQYDLMKPVLGTEVNMLEKQSTWIVGGDGWAYDIGFGGLDHVLSRGKNVNVIVLDTEMYSNTGGQASKSTPTSASVKFAEGGQTLNKKDLGQIAMLYGNVYVSSIAMGADYEQTIKAFNEAESYEGTSLIIALSPCASWGMDMKNMMSIQKLAVDSGYWSLYRYDPRRIDRALNPFQLDSKRTREDLTKFLAAQKRFKKLNILSPETAKRLQHNLQEFSDNKRETLIRNSMTETQYLQFLKVKFGDTVGAEDEVLILYGSETGNARSLAQGMSHELKRRNCKTKVMAMDDFDFADLIGMGEKTERTILFAVSTCGQGEYPKNCQFFMTDLEHAVEQKDTIGAKVKYAVFGLGDSHYVYYNEAANKLDEFMEKCGATRMMDVGLGNDQDPDKYDTAFEEWTPTLFDTLKCEEPSQELLPPRYTIQVMPNAVAPKYYPSFKYVSSLPVEMNKRMTAPNYDRDFRHYIFDASEVESFKFSIGDCLGVAPSNSLDECTKIMDLYNVKPDDVIEVSDSTKSYNLRMLDVFRQKLDILGKPRRRFYELLTMVPGINKEDKDTLNYLLSAAGKEEFETLRNNEYWNHIDVLKRFPSAMPELSYLLEYVPQLQRRLYSIANSPKMNPDKIELFVAKNDWVTQTAQEYREGVCTKFMQDLNPERNDWVFAKVHGGTINVPKSHEAPCILTGLGCGLAPLRAQIQERVWTAAKNKRANIGEMTLIFGSRHQKDEYFFQDELEDYHSSGNKTLTNLFTAFSRDQGTKDYVTDRIREHSKSVYEDLIEKNGYFYYCGAGGNVPTGVRNEVKNAFKQHGNMTEEQAEAKVIEMQLNGHYNVEAW
eukprot:CAMPEP_0202690710 /NCGR_PEP_ID=MMETSP1385-20130828/5619_1 /ASSEMBLY_ACC=CAM_ASM_000861 /TAXON_ID=933848 /ORGANISM="Elphidium margaritaceum" /LENGTH=1757 /DNA_ID=CAMNT_0049346001 /DNA_START=418 /DNA_END=5691 /DNA_ORIENTATION=+